MATKEKKPTLKELIVEVKMLRSVVIGLVGRDPEGEYKPEFVEKMLDLMKGPADGKFMSPEDFESGE